MSLFTFLFFLPFETSRGVAFSLFFRVSRNLISDTDFNWSSLLSTYTRFSENDELPRSSPVNTRLESLRFLDETWKYFFAIQDVESRCNVFDY